MKDTVFPEVTTILLVCGDNSIDVIGFGKLRLVETVRVRRSHHLSYVERWEHEPEVRGRVIPAQIMKSENERMYGG